MEHHYSSIRRTKLKNIRLTWEGYGPLLARERHTQDRVVHASHHAKELCRSFPSSHEPFDLQISVDGAETTAQGAPRLILLAFDHGANDTGRPGHCKGNTWERSMCGLWNEATPMGQRQFRHSLLPRLFRRS